VCRDQRAERDIYAPGNPWQNRFTQDGTSRWEETGFDFGLTIFDLRFDRQDTPLETHLIQGQARIQNRKSQIQNRRKGLPMARIFYSMAGEGRGHATRVRTLVEGLRHDHQVTLLAPGDAHGLLERTYRGADVEILPLPGLRFQYNDHGLAYAWTIREGLRYLWRLPGLVGRLAEMLRSEKPDLVLTDFEPALPRAARRCGIPFVSFDHQHFLTTYDLSSLPWNLRLWAKALGAFVSLFYQGQVETIVSAFFSPPLRASCRNVVQVGVLLRPEIVVARRTHGDYLLVYLRREVPERVLGTLKNCGRPVRVYGLGDRPRDGRLEFCPISEQGFIRDLIGCHALVSTAGNQLVGEALYLRKPVFALPEQKNHEQFINAHFLQQSGAGVWSPMCKFDDRALGSFLDRCEELRSGIDPRKYNGNAAALAAVRRHLGHPVPISAATAPATSLDIPAPAWEEVTV
jgi:uncharacterized protein (TIGR00661 family)